MAVRPAKPPARKPPPVSGEAVGDDGSGAGSSSTSLPRWAYYVYVVRAAVALALGVAVLLAGSGLARLATFVAVYWIAAALITLRWVGANRGARGSRIGMLAGATALAAGVALALRGPLSGQFSTGALLDFFGFTAIVTGGLRLSGLLHDDQLARDRPRRRYRLVAGSLDVLLGAVLLVADERTATEIRIVVGVWALSTGTLLLLDGLMLRRLARQR